MKRLSEKQRLWLVRRQRNQLKRTATAKQNSEASRENKAAKEEFFKVSNILPATKYDLRTYAERAAFVPPRKVSLINNYDRTLKFIMDFQYLFHSGNGVLCSDGIRRRAYADFAKIEEIDAGAGLVLAAEVDRWARATPGRPDVHDHLWKENVRDFFLEAGLFELLGVDPKSVNVQPATNPSRQTLQFITGRTSDGADAERLRQSLEALSERSIGPRPQVYNAISEAITNVSHAYPKWHRRWPGRTTRRWWASGFWAKSTRTVGIQLYDQGAGIPATLPRQVQWPLVANLIPLIDPERTHAGRIEAALQYGRTSTGLPGRGKGLAEMAEWIEKTGSGFLRILSGSGRITYRPGARVERMNLNAPFCGTLVEWELCLDG